MPYRSGPSQWALRDGADSRPLFCAERSLSGREGPTLTEKFGLLNINMGKGQKKKSPKIPKGRRDLKPRTHEASGASGTSRAAAEGVVWPRAALQDTGAFAA